jgi:hypothetical protein
VLVTVRGNAWRVAPNRHRSAIRPRYGTGR